MVIKNSFVDVAARVLQAKHFLVWLDLCKWKKKNTAQTKKSPPITYT
jgi:hypothetical protein